MGTEGRRATGVARDAKIPYSSVPDLAALNDLEHTVNAHTNTSTARWLLSLGLIAGVAVMSALSGCTALGFVGGMIDSYERTGTSDIKAKYDGLEGKTFAVIVAADRSIQADNPEIVPLLCNQVTRDLADNCGASGVVPAEEVLRFQYQRPGWVAMTPTDLAKELEVERLVYVDLSDFNLTDEGNPYLWNGVAAATVQVLEADSDLGDTFAFREYIRVTFPDQEGLSPMQIPGETVRLELSRRIVYRVSWLFFDHKEHNSLKYGTPRTQE